MYISDKDRIHDAIIPYALSRVYQRYYAESAYYAPHNPHITKELLLSFKKSEDTLKADAMAGLKGGKFKTLKKRLQKLMRVIDRYADKQQWSCKKYLIAIAIWGDALNTAEQVILRDNTLHEISEDLMYVAEVQGIAPLERLSKERKEEIKDDFIKIKNSAEKQVYKLHKIVQDYGYFEDANLYPAKQVA